MPMGLAILKREVWTSYLPLNILVENNFVATFVRIQFAPAPNIKPDLVYNQTGSHFRLSFLIYIFVVFYSGHPLFGLQTYF